MIGVYRDPHLEQRMQVTSCCGLSKSIEVVRLEVSSPPRATAQPFEEMSIIGRWQTLPILLGARRTLVSL